MEADRITRIYQNNSRRETNGSTVATVVEVSPSRWPAARHLFGDHAKAIMDRRDAVVRSSEQDPYKKVDVVSNDGQSVEGIDVGVGNIEEAVRKLGGTGLTVILDVSPLTHRPVSVEEISPLPEAAL